jgi:hypothetical protein
VIVIRISAKVRALGRALRKPGFIPEITERAAASWAAARHRPLPSPATAFALSRRLVLRTSCWLELSASHQRILDHTGR